MVVCCSGSKGVRVWCVVGKAYVVEVSVGGSSPLEVEEFVRLRDLPAPRPGPVLRFTVHTVSLSFWYGGTGGQPQLTALSIVNVAT